MGRNPLHAVRALLRPEPGAGRGRHAARASHPAAAPPEGPAPTGVSVQAADSDPAASATSVIPSPRTASEPPVVTPLHLPSWRDQRARFAALGAAVVTMVITAGIFFVNAGGTWERSQWLSPGPSGDAVLVEPAVTDPAPTPTPPPAVIANPVVSVETRGFFSWAVLDRRTGARYGSDNQDKTTFSESMIKAWIAADFLKRTADRGATPDARRTDQLVRMIRDSHNGAAESLWLASGGDASIQRLIKTCALADTRVYPAWWSQTFISARDAVTMGECLANGTAAGPAWTDWVLNEMRNVRGTVEEQPNGGRWGIIDALPADVAATVAIKNGWTWHKDNTWNVNCLAIHSDWILAVMSDYPGSNGLAYGAKLCASVAQQTLIMAL